MVGKLEEMRPLGRPRWRWEDNIKLDLREVWWGVMDWLMWLRIGANWRVSTVMDLWVPHNMGNFLSSWVAGGLSRRNQLHGVSQLYVKGRDHLGDWRSGGRILLKLVLEIL
jgi:hypothetical protein